jgi:hypothetical protein
MKKKLAAVFVSLLFAALCLTAAAQLTDKQWQAKAVEKYPALGVKGSELNKRFIDAYSNRRKTDPAFFANPQWPLVLADELAIPSPPPSLKASPPQPTQPPAEVVASPQPIGSNAPSVPVLPIASARATPRPAIQPTEANDSSLSGGVVLISIAVAITVGGVIGLIAWASTPSAAARRKEAEKGQREADILQREVQRARTAQAQIVCPHCQTRGHVTTHKVKLKKGVDGRKAAAAILTGFWSLLFIGLSREEETTEATCSNCGATWHF